MKNNKVGLTKKILELNNSYNEFTTSDLQGVVSAMMMPIVSDPIQRNYYEGRIILMLEKANGSRNKLIIDYLKFQSNLLKNDLRRSGYKVM